MTRPASRYSPQQRVTLRVLDTLVDATPVDGELVELRQRDGLRRLFVDRETGDVVSTRLTKIECLSLGVVDVVGCETCRAGTPVGHLGSAYCRSGALRAGGTRSHCTCDTCF